MGLEYTSLINCMVNLIHIVSFLMHFIKSHSDIHFIKYKISELEVIFFNLENYLNDRIENKKKSK